MNSRTKEEHPMSFTEAVSTCFQKYTDFSGRARRSEYWYFCLFNMILSMIASFIFGADSVLTSLVSLAVLLPGLAVCCRRLHDIGKSGWWMLIALVPIVGAILLIVWVCTDSQPGANLYGENPKA